MKFLVFILLFILSLSAFAQKNMVTLGSDSLTAGAFKVRTDGLDYNEFSFSAAYDYQVSTHQQVGARVKYFTDDYGGTSFTEKTLALGVTHNFQDDLTDSFYASLYGGYVWYDNRKPAHKDEYLQYTIALGKRFSLEKLGLKNLSYSPQISYSQSENTGSSDIKSSFLEIRYIQFSFFF